MKKTLKVVLINQEKDGFIIGDLCKRLNDSTYSDEKAGHICVAIKNNLHPNSDWVSQQVLLLSDDEPKYGELVYSIRGIIGKFGDFENSYANECRPVVASFPKIEGSMLISPEAIQQIAHLQGQCVCKIDSDMVNSEFPILLDVEQIKA